MNFGICRNTCSVKEESCERIVVVSSVYLSLRTYSTYAKEREMELCPTHLSILYIHM
jgi:hypothetical protein